VEELDMFVFFPGELWQGRTWIERTPFYVREPIYLDELFLSCPERTYLRYMDLPVDSDLYPHLSIDEIGYVLHPPELDFDITLYRKRFSHKRVKDILKVIGTFMGHDAVFHMNRLDDFEVLVRMGLDYFGAGSYLHDDRFREGFREVTHFLRRKGLLRMVSLQLNGRVAAVDIGAVYQGVYTVFLGGTHPDFLGVAKAMNMHHIVSACNEGFSKVDFLCGDFHWKKLWHLDPEPLYKFVTPHLVDSEAEMSPPFATSTHPAASLEIPFKMGPFS
jgi:hypothetical protein